MLAAFFTLVSCLAYSSSLKMEASISSEMSVHFQQVHGVIFQETEFFSEYRA
jgi:outer membrane receptor for ferrienterochelin and colicin